MSFNIPELRRLRHTLFPLVSLSVSSREMRVFWKMPMVVAFFELIIFSSYSLITEIAVGEIVCTEKMSFKIFEY